MGDIQYSYESCNGRKPWTMRPFRIQCGNWRASDDRCLTPSIHINLLRCELEGVCVQSFHSFISICWGANLKASAFRVSIHINLLRCNLEGVCVHTFHSYQSAEVQSWRRLCSEFPFIHINLLRCKLEGVSVQSFHSYISICWGANLNASVFRFSIHTYQSAEVQSWRRWCSRVSTSNTSQTFVYNFKLINLTPQMHWSPIKTLYRSGTVNLESFVGKDFLQNKWKYELTTHFKHEMIRKHFKETSNKVELRISRVRINLARPVFDTVWKFSNYVRLSLQRKFSSLYPEKSEAHLIY